MIDRIPEIMDIKSLRRYAVVIPLIKTAAGYEVLFEVRASGLRQQPGEICFPGGGAEDGETPWQTAEREACDCKRWDCTGNAAGYFYFTV
mgnify:CR=1 FL=1